MSNYADAIKRPASTKHVFAKSTFIKQFFGWIPSGTGGIWYQSSIELVERLTEDGAEATENTTWAALVAQSVATVGAWWWDDATKRLYYKPLTSTTAFSHFVVGTIVFRFSEDGIEDDHSRPHDPRFVSAPAVRLAIGEVFDSKIAQTGSGSLGLASTDGLFSRTDFEIDGDIEIYEAIEGA